MEEYFNFCRKLFGKLLLSTYTNQQYAFRYSRLNFFCTVSCLTYVPPSVWTYVRAQCITTLSRLTPSNDVQIVSNANAKITYDFAVGTGLLIRYIQTYICLHVVRMCSFLINLRVTKGLYVVNKTN